MFIGRLWQRKMQVSQIQILILAQLLPQHSAPQTDVVRCLIKHVHVRILDVIPLQCVPYSILPIILFTETEEIAPLITFNFKS